MNTGRRPGTLKEVIQRAFVFEMYLNCVILKLRIYFHFYLLRSVKKFCHSECLCLVQEDLLTGNTSCFKHSLSWTFYLMILMKFLIVHSFFILSFSIFFSLFPFLYLTFISLSFNIHKCLLWKLTAFFKIWY